MDTVAAFVATWIVEVVSRKFHELHYCPSGGQKIVLRNPMGPIATWLNLPAELNVCMCMMR